jgi:hypothetical protein
MRCAFPPYARRLGVSDELPALAAAVHGLRGQRVMLDSDLAALYGVETRVLNQAVRRNAMRFPDAFMFQLTDEEHARLRSHFVISKTEKSGRGGRRYNPYVFTEHGAVMLASVLNSERAVAMSLVVVRTFVALREQLAGNVELRAKLEALERKVGTHDQAIAGLIDAIRQLTNTPAAPQRGIGFTADISQSKD